MVRWGAQIMQMRIDIDAEKQKAATQDERQEFLTALFSAASVATADYGAHVDFSDSHHWVITFPDEYEPRVSALFAPKRAIGSELMMLGRVSGLTQPNGGEGQ